MRDGRCSVSFGASASDTGMCNEQGSPPADPAHMACTAGPECSAQCCLRGSLACSIWTAWSATQHKYGMEVNLLSSTLFLRTEGWNKRERYLPEHASTIRKVSLPGFQFCRLWWRCIWQSRPWDTYCSLSLHLFSKTQATKEENMTLTSIHKTKLSSRIVAPYLWRAECSCRLWADKSRGSGRLFVYCELVAFHLLKVWWNNVRTCHQRKTKVVWTTYLLRRLGSQFGEGRSTRRKC